MLQQVFVAIIFLAAASYLVWLVVGQFKTKQGCSGGCSKCSVDFTKIEEKLLNKKFD